jgi:ribosome recycling factor
MDEESIRTRMQQVLDLIISDIGSIRTGRATPALVSDLAVLVYGGTQRLKVQELANINVVDSQTITIEPWDNSIIGEIKQGIMSANIGLNPVLDGDIIRISLPIPTLEDREKYVKLLSTKLESGRIMIRGVRSDAIRSIKKDFEEKKLTEDEKFALEKHLQQITDSFIEKIDECGENKKKELLQV